LDLSANGDGGNTGKIDYGKVGAGLREDIKDDRFVNNLLIFTADLVSDLINACPHLVKVGELLFVALFEYFIKLRIRSI
jgi:hypothetical protein